MFPLLSVTTGLREVPTGMLERLEPVEGRGLAPYSHKFDHELPSKLPLGSLISGPGEGGQDTGHLPRGVRGLHEGPHERHPGQAGCGQGLGVAGAHVPDGDDG